MGKTRTTAVARQPYPFWLGGVAASMAACCTHPLDVLRVRMQTATTKQTMKGAVKDILAQKGIRGLYTGLSASIFRQMTYSLTRLGVYDLIKDKLSNNGQKQLSMAQMTFCAAVAGALGGVAGNPADIVLVRMVSDPFKPAAQQVHYRNAFQGVYRMIETGGVSSLFRGIAPNTFRAVIMNSAQLVSYDVFKALLVKKAGMEDGLPVHLTASTIAGTVATTIAAPVDVIKSRVMSSSTGEGPIEILKTSFKQQGPAFLFRGWLPAWIRLTPNTVIMFVCLEKLRHVVDFTRGITPPVVLK